MTTVNDIYQQALLSEAAYADLTGTEGNQVGIQGTVYLLISCSCDDRSPHRCRIALNRF